MAGCSYLHNGGSQVSGSARSGEVALHRRADPGHQVVDAGRRHRLDPELVARERQAHQMRSDQLDAQHGIVNAELGGDTARERAGQGVVQQLPCQGLDPTVTDVGSVKGPVREAVPSSSRVPSWCNGCSGMSITDAVNRPSLLPKK